MKLASISVPNSFEIMMIPYYEGTKIETGIGNFKITDELLVYDLHQEKHLSRLKLQDEADGADLDFYLRRGIAHLVEVTQVAKDGSVLVHIEFFNGNLLQMGELEVGLDEKIKNTARKKGFVFQTMDELSALLIERLTVIKGTEHYFFLVSGPAAVDVFDSDEEKNDVIDNKNNTILEQAFALYGDGILVPIERTRIEFVDTKSKNDIPKEIYFANRLIYERPPKKEVALRLAKGTLKFTDYTKTGEIQVLARAAIGALTADRDSYLSKWDEYGAKEGEIFLDKAQAIGVMKILNVEKSDNGVDFYLEKPVPTILKPIKDSLELTNLIPIYIQQPKTTWGQYILSFNEASKTNLDANRIIGKILRICENRVELELDSVPILEGNHFIWSIGGEKTQIKRRIQARNKIQEGRSANPLLGLLIEEKGKIPRTRTGKMLEPLTSFLLENTNIFKNKPTPTQKKAISIALNTPDIALIQGPPGTGKTTVITAILERLNEEHDKRKSVRGQILVTGHQHDAVENIVSRLSVNSLPTVKFGKKSGSGEYGEFIFSKRMKLWCEKVTDEIRKKNPQIRSTEEQKHLENLFKLYSLSPSISNAKKMIENILSLSRSVLPTSITDRARDILGNLTEDNRDFNFSILKSIRAIRIKKNSFEDDGPERASDLYVVLKDRLTKNDQAILESVEQWKSVDGFGILDDIIDLKKRLLARYSPKPYFKVEKSREDVVSLFSDVATQLNRSIGGKSKKETILAEFLHELESNPDKISEAIEDYNYVYAATTQYSVSDRMASVKGKYDELLFQYDTVIIDEASRVSPRDLLIPMALAEKRIILVGDHRQLPHMIDEKIVELLCNEEESEDKEKRIEAYRESMFEYLFKRLQKLEENDGIQRTITLDAQFRTHPLLGKFSSENFYELYDEWYDSPLKEDQFKHNLVDTEGKPAMWIDLPYSQGKESRPGTSIKRVVEAEVIAERLKNWMDSKAGAKLTFGVITFYSEQVKEINRQLEQHGITEKQLGIDSWKITDAYSVFLGSDSDSNDIERLRIGTVDSFQGMEFDVVILSVVRTHDLGKIKAKANPIARGLFGFLISKERLCVAMSRQKKLLCVVGDGDFMQCPLAEKNIPALKNFYELCIQHGVIL